MELQPVRTRQDASSIAAKRAPSVAGRSLGSSSEEDEDRNESLPSPITAPTEQAEIWYKPRINLYRVLVTFYAFVIMGANDASYGPIIPYLEEYYGQPYTVISLVFLSPFVGYVSSALCNNAVHMRFGQRGVAFIGPSCHLISYIIICLHPPYPVLIVAFIFAGFGNGIEDAAYNAWIGAMANANELLGFLHGFYGLGATIAPLVATAMITKANLQWFTWYYIMVGAATIELAVSLAAFWGATAAQYREKNARSGDAGGSRLKEATLHMPAARVTWCCALFLIGYVGCEVALGGWIVAFMIDVREAGAFASGMTATGFWMGITVGRLVLGFVTPRIGEKLAICVSKNFWLPRSQVLQLTCSSQIYLPISMGLELLFWLVPQFYVGAVAVGLLGFFLGPLFPAAMVACTKLLPKHLHVSSIGFAAAFGGSGGAIFPYAIGALAQAKGVQVLQPFILALLGAILVVWLMLPRLGKKKD